MTLVLNICHSLRNSRFRFFLAKRDRREALTLPPSRVSCGFLHKDLELIYDTVRHGKLEIVQCFNLLLDHTMRAAVN